MQRDLHLEIEILEDRVLLSTVQVDASGSVGDEAFDLVIGGEIVASFALQGTQQQSFVFDSTAVITADEIRIEFTNDLMNSAEGTDRNLIIDKITIDEEVFETESPFTFSTGSYSEFGLAPGNWQTEYLHTNGFFQYSSLSPSTLQVIAAGTTGDEVLQVEINGQTIGQFQVSTELESYTINSELNIDPNRDVVRVAFTNDLFAPGIDRDLIVDKIIVDGIEFESEAETTYSTGTWVAAGVPHEGFLNSNTLHVTGYFEYEAATDIVVRAAGEEGTEQIRLQIDGLTATTYDLSTNFETFTYRHFTKLTPDQIRVEFFDDVYLPENGIDKNVLVDWIRIEGMQIETESNDVYSNATYSNDGLEPGFGRGSILHTNGFFQFGFLPLVDEFSLPEDSQNVPLAVLNNDRIDGAPGLEIVVGPSNGIASIVNGELVYSPNSDYEGVDKLYYRLDVGSAVVASVEINVRGSHQQPQNLINPAVPAELTPSGKTLIVERLVKLPLDFNGRQLRVNMMATLGDRVFVVTDGAFGGGAQIYELLTDADGTVTAQVFLYVGAAVVSNGFEIDRSTPLNGLRSVAFHPEFDTNGRFYVTYVGKRPTSEIDTFYISNPENPVGVDSVLAEFTFDFATGLVDTTSYREVFRVGMPVNDHPIRQAVFNPFAQPGDEDYGLLYIGHGDGSEQSAVAGDGQNRDGLGKILRINPLASDEQPFTVPDSNPFVGLNDFPDSVYAFGFRNPHNLTFAQDSSGQVHLLATEIGRDNIEEINVVVKGGNYGWADREGVFIHLNGEGQVNGINANIANLPSDDANNDYIYPVSVFGHDGIPGDFFVGQAIAGGHVIQNGSSELDDQFVFLEFATDGRAYHFDFSDALQQTTDLDLADPNRDSPDDLTWLNPQELTILFDHDNDESTTPLVRDSLKDVLDDEPDFETILSAGKVRADLRLGQGPEGELYILNKRNGWIYIVSNTRTEVSAPQDVS